MQRKKISLEDFDYFLPKELIAQSPTKSRDTSRLLHLKKDSGSIKHLNFKDFPSLLKEGDVLIRNVSKVIPARLFGRKESGAKIEILLSERLSETENSILYKVIAKPAKRLKPGTKIIFKEALLSAQVVKREGELLILEFCFNGVFEEVLNKLGKIPLPKYIKQELKDKDRYQTIYAKEGHSVAAPTAGLHFTEKIIEQIKKKGVEILDIQLDVGLGTFAPIRDNDIEKHKMHKEKFRISKNVAEKINSAKNEERRIVAIGTTTLRALESAFIEGELQGGDFETDIFIYPGFKFNLVDALLTNFHLPKSSLILLVSAFAGKDNILQAYNIAVKEKYRFFSFGDAMFID